MKFTHEALHEIWHSVPSTPGGSTRKLVTTGTVAFEKINENGILLSESRIKGQIMTLTSYSQKSSYTRQANCIYQSPKLSMKSFF